MRLFCLFLAACALLSPAARAADWSAKTVDKPAPAGLGESIQATLAARALQISKGDRLVYELWFRRDIPLKSKPSSTEGGLGALKETTLIGAALVPKSQRDYRDDELYAGLYTIRTSLQPQDGNHLGTALHPYFAVLTPAKLDTSLDGITTYKQLVKASSKESATDHPFILSLFPVEKDEGDYPRVTKPASEHKGVRVKLAAQAGEEKADLIFDLIIEGVSVH